MRCGRALRRLHDPRPVRRPRHGDCRCAGAQRQRSRLQRQPPGGVVRARHGHNAVEEHGRCSERRRSVGLDGLLCLAGFHRRRAQLPGLRQVVVGLPPVPERRGLGDRHGRRPARCESTPDGAERHQTLRQAALDRLFPGRPRGGSNAQGDRARLRQRIHRDGFRPDVRAAQPGQDLRRGSGAGADCGRRVTVHVDACDELPGLLRQCVHQSVGHLPVAVFGSWSAPVPDRHADQHLDWQRLPPA